MKMLADVQKIAESYQTPSYIPVPSTIEIIDISTWWYTIPHWETGPTPTSVMGSC
jgi:hypothetical protein